MTEKLYYKDARVLGFEGRVLECCENKGRFEIVLDRSAFFPEGGGQGGDRGTLGGVTIFDTHERGGVIVHYAEAPLPVGETVRGCVDGELRRARMQIHSGEHVVSGIAHREWGCENVGFHMTEKGAVIDFDRELNEQQLQTLETLANEAVWQDLPVRVHYPTDEELENLSFRQKKELSGQIRLVEIPGVDMCACCAPHVASTGEIGLIMFTDVMRHRGGVRITLLAGRAAYEYDAALRAQSEVLSRLFSVPRTELSAGAEKLTARQAALESERAALERKYVSMLAGTVSPTEGNLCLFKDASLSAAAMRDLASALADKCAVAAVFAGGGNDWRYVLASGKTDLRAFGKGFNAALHGRGGGSAGMIQGSVAASKDEIEEYFHG